MRTGDDVEDCIEGRRRIVVPTRHSPFGISRMRQRRHCINDRRPE